MTSEQVIGFGMLGHIHPAVNMNDRSVQIEGTQGKEDHSILLLIPAGGMPLPHEYHSPMT